MSCFPTQIDSLDTLALLGDRERFSASVEWIGKNLRFDIVSTDFVFVLHELTNHLINNFFSTCPPKLQFINITEHEFICRTFLLAKCKIGQ